jgi:hypothetical protein
MRKVQHYSGDAFDFHKQVVEAKKETAKRTLQSLETRIRECYIDYNQHFVGNDLCTMSPFSFDAEEKEVLRNMYKFRQKAFSNLFFSLTTTESNQRDMLCPNCTLTDCSQLDHYMPKSEFPEFSANPLNLMQCCAICNQRKSDLWLNEGQPIFLNLYLDDLPQKQYLFVDIHIDNGIPAVRFYLQNSASIDSVLFRRIECHYEGFGLCKRFAERADSVISELFEYHAAAKRAKIPFPNFKEMVVSKASQEQQDFGFNYWKSILILTCLGNYDFCSCLENRNATLG